MLVWSQDQGDADCWLYQEDSEPDPLGALTFPFFGAFLAQYHGILLHAAAADVDGEAWLFVGPSGYGKSHWVRQCQAYGGKVLGEDRIVLRAHSGSVWAYGTPWHWAGQLCEPNGAPVGRVFFLRQAEADAMLPVSPSALAMFLLRSAVLPIYDKQLMASILGVLHQTALQATAFHLGYATDQSFPARLFDAPRRRINRHAEVQGR